MNEIDHVYRRVGRLEDRDGWLSSWTPTLGLIGVIFAIILASFSVWQWWDLRQALKVSERSWIKLGIAWPTQPASGSPVSASGQIMNIGRSPATDLWAHGVLLIVPSDQSVGSQTLSKGNSLNTQLLFPNDPMPVQFSMGDGQTHPNANFSDSQVSDLLAGKTYLAVLGTVQYSDQFGEHWEEFCRWQGTVPALLITPPTAPIGIVSATASRPTNSPRWAYYLNNLHQLANSGYVAPRQSPLCCKELRSGGNSPALESWPELNLTYLGVDGSLRRQVCTAVRCF